MIAEVEGRDVRHVTLQELTHMLKGPAGSEVGSTSPAAPAYPRPILTHSSGPRIKIDLVRAVM